MRYEGAIKFSEKLVAIKHLESFALEMDKVDIDNNGKFGSIAIFENLKHFDKMEKFHFSFEEFLFFIFLKKFMFFFFL